MKVALFAPLKSPQHPVPSGDRTMARNLIAALELGGHDVTLASELRLFDGDGDLAVQDDLFAQARAEVDRLLASPQARTWDAWLTYHNYYKAPDLIGPAVSSGLGIPYLQIESTRARKRLTGPWARFAGAAEAASDDAHTIMYLTHRDAETLRRDAPQGQRVLHLPPFLSRAQLPEASTLAGPMISVGMMRPGDKLASYRLIAETLALIPDAIDWHIVIAGDGTARPDVAAMMALFGSRVRMAGQLDEAGLADLYRTASLMFWPGVNEAFGLAYLEAQSAGVPVVAQDRPGVRDVVVGLQPEVEAGPQAMATRIVDLLTNETKRRDAGAQARAVICRDHLLGPAAATLSAALEATI
jgi:glycosyltransferase involved in cell wall biosynthesis